VIPHRLRTVPACTDLNRPLKFRASPGQAPLQRNLVVFRESVDVVMVLIGFVAFFLDATSVVL
jgi:hypothetical protein